MNGRKYIPGLDGYDNGEYPTLSVWDEWDAEETQTELLDADDD
ncbi:hypothetical protein ABZ905_37050 [Streptomyces parvus]